MHSVEMALFEAVLNCQELKFRWVPPDLCVFETRRTDLYYAGFPVAVFLEQDEPQPVDGRVGHSVQRISLFVWLKMFELSQVLYDVVELLLMEVRPMELGALGREPSELVCSHSVVGAEFP